MKQQKKSAGLFSSRGMASFLSYCKPYRLKLIAVAIVFILANALITILPIFIGLLVDALSHPTHPNAWLWVVILVALSIGHDMFWHVAEFLYRGLIFRISFDYESFLFHRVITKPYPYFVDKFTGKISSYITTTSNELKWLLDNFMFGYLGSLVSVISVVSIMTSINWQTGLIIVVCLIGMVIIGRFTMRKDVHFQKIETDVNTTKNGRIIDAIANFASVKSFHKELTEYRYVVAQQKKTYEAGRRAFLWGILFWTSMSIFVRTLMWPGIVLLNMWLFLNHQITLGQFATVLSTALLFSQTIWEVVWNVSQFSQRVAKIEEAHGYLFGATNIVKSADDSDDAQIIVPTFKRILSIRNLRFAYPDKPDADVLSGISFDIKYGERIGVVGRSGSGKSTLTKLLLDQYDATHGDIALDGVAIDNKSLSQLITYVPQDTGLFHRTIAENISYAADHNMDLREIERVAKLAEAHEFIAKLPQGYDTLVGERGIKLSGGQRQRIAIARAMLRDAPIMVLDEATSALDSESEVLVQKALENLWQNKTVLVIAHRLSTLRTMDRIIVMDEGKIIEQGTHHELLTHAGIYAKLWKHQSGGFIEE